MRETLYAQEGMVYTNGKDIGKVVFLGENDNRDNWHEITETEAEQMFGFA